MSKENENLNEAENSALNIAENRSTSCIRTWKEEWQSCLGFERHKKLLADNHMINIRIRKDGEWHEIDADWLKTLVRQEF